MTLEHSKTFRIPGGLSNFLRPVILFNILTSGISYQTYNVDAQTGESSACATALLCGVKARYETLGLDAGARFNNCASTINSKVTSLVDWAHEAGK